MILDRILATKREEVAAAKARVSPAQMERRAQDGPAPRGFHARLAGGPGAPPPAPAAGGPLRVIAEVKKASPSKGLIRPDFDPVSIARSYREGNATCLSVLTDEQYFQGHLDYLRAIREAEPDLPLLRKDFTIDHYQIHEARAAGADAVLLIVAALSPETLRSLQREAEAVGLDALVEVHTREEMWVALELGARLLGINNRNLHSFETTLQVTDELAAMAPQGSLLVSESGIGAPADLARVAAAGARAVLVGESLMRQPDPGAALRKLQGLEA